MELLPIAAALLAIAVPLFVFAVVPARVQPAGPVPVDATAAPTTPSSLAWVAPGGAVDRLDRSLQLAGLLPEWTVHRVLRAKLLATLAALAVGAVVVIAGPGNVALRALLAVALVALAYVAPDAVVA